MDGWMDGWIIKEMRKKTKCLSNEPPGRSHDASLMQSLITLPSTSDLVIS
jgi:hypothetical protein